MVKIAFIQEELRDRFGVMILSAVLKRDGHACDVFVQEKSKDIINEVLSYNPGIIAFSTMTPGIKFALGMANEFKKFSKAFIIMGGAHPTFYPEVINENSIDAICIGEGEGALLELASCIDKGRDFTSIRNLWVKSKGSIYKNDLRDLVDINTLPFPDRDIYFDKYQELRNAATKKIFIGRGCPFSCTYCFNPVLKKIYTGKGKYVRFLDIDRAIAEIKHLKKRYDMKWLQINGDTVNSERKWFMDFLDRYKQEIDVPFLCNIRIDLLDREMVKKMKEARCNRVDFGLEHGDEQVRKNILKRNMTDRQIVDGANLLHEYGIRVFTANLIGVPGETVLTAMKTVELNRKVRPEQALSYILQPYPKTEINEYSKKRGYLDHDYNFSEDCSNIDLYYGGGKKLPCPLKLKDAGRIINLYSLFNFLIQYKALTLIVKQLIKLPPNRIFRCIGLIPIVANSIKYADSFDEKISSVNKLFKVLVT